MIEYIILPLIASFLISAILTPFWIKKAYGIGLIWPDMNKFSKNKVAGSGGIIAVLAFIIGVLIYIAYRVFILGEPNFLLVQIFALLTTIFFLAGIGLVDDLLGWQRGGLRRRHRIILVALAAIPLMAINAGRSEISIPFMGAVDLGIFYPLIIIPLGIIGATTTYNFLAGFNGLESGQGIIILSALTFVAYSTGNSWLALICMIMVLALIGFLMYNISPAKAFPGDSLTYSLGGLIAIVAILGNFEKIAVFFFIPYIIETALKSRGKLVKHSFGKPNQDGSLDLKYDKIYGLTHLSIYLMKKAGIRPTEGKVVLSIWIFQIIVIIIGLLIFAGGINAG